MTIPIHKFCEACGAIRHHNQFGCIECNYVKERMDFNNWKQQSDSQKLDDLYLRINRLEKLLCISR